MRLVNTQAMKAAGLSDRQVLAAVMLADHLGGCGMIDCEGNLIIGASQEEPVLYFRIFLHKDERGDVTYNATTAELFSPQQWRERYELESDPEGELEEEWREAGDEWDEREESTLDHFFDVDVHRRENG